MRKGFALAAVAALVIGISTVAFVPSVRAQVGEILNTWFRIETPGGESEVAIGGPMKFTPLYPTYLPARLQSSGGGISAVGLGGASTSVGLTYYNDGQFVAITQTKSPADKALPAGREVTINSQPGVLVTGLEGTFEYGSRIPEDARLTFFFGTPPAEPVPHRGSIAYTDGKRLTWYAGDVKVEVLSNLPEAEMLKIAESLVPAEAGEGEPPFQPPLNLPSGDEGGGVTIQEGPTESNP